MPSSHPRSSRNWNGLGSRTAPPTGTGYANTNAPAPGNIPAAPVLTFKPKRGGSVILPKPPIANKEIVVKAAGMTLVSNSKSQKRETSTSTIASTSKSQRVVSSAAPTAGIMEPYRSRPLRSRAFAEIARSS